VLRKFNIYVVKCTNLYKLGHSFWFMMEELTLEGNEFLGKFQAVFQTVPYRFGGDTHDRHHYFWKGQCAIECKFGEPARALFSTPKEGSRDFVKKLEEALLSFGSEGTSWPPRPEIKDYKAIVDIVLGGMYEEYQQSIQDENTIIPQLSVRRLYIGDLTQKELVVPA